MPLRPIAKTGAILKDESGKQVYLDGTISESRDLSVEWSQHPLEDGSKITDHGTVQPTTVKISGEFSRLSGDSRTLEDREDALESMAKAKLPLKVISGLRLWKQMVISSLSIQRESGGGQNSKVDIGLEEIQTSEVRTREVNLGSSVATSGSSRVDAGAVGTTAATGSQANALSADLIDSEYNYLR